MARSRYAVPTGLIAALALAWPLACVAEDPQARSWAASCASCHGTDGRSAGAVPSLAGRSKADLFEIMKEFREGRRKAATVMHQYAVGYSEAELERIAGYFSKQPR